MIKLYVDDVSFEGSIREVQERIDSVIGVSYSVFVATSFFLQGESDLFTAATPADRLRYLREILSLVFWDKCYDRTSDLLKKEQEGFFQLKGSRDTLQRALEDYNSQYDSQNEQRLLRLKKSREDKLVVDSDRKVSIDKDIRQFSFALKEVELLKEQVWIFNSARLRFDLQKKELILEKDSLRIPKLPLKMFHSVEKFEKETEQELYKLHSEVVACSTEENIHKETIRVVCGICPRCKQIVSEEFATRLRNETEKKIIVLQHQQEHLQREISKKTIKLDKLKKYRESNRVVEEVLKKITQLEIVNVKIQSLEKIISTEDQKRKDILLRIKKEEVDEKKLQELKNQLSIKNSEIDAASRELRDIEKQLNMLTLVKEKIASTKSQLKKIQSSFESLEKSMTQLDTLKSIFSKTGVSFFVIKKVVKGVGGLETTCNNILKRFGNWRVEFKLKSSTNRNTLDIFVHVDDKYIRKYETFSGGERELLNFSIRVALSRLLRRRGTDAPIQFVVLDEIFGFLDEYNREILESTLVFLKEEFQQLFVVSHISLSIPFDTVIEVEKVDDISYLGGNSAN